MSTVFCTLPVPSDYVLRLASCAAMPDDSVHAILAGLRVVSVCRGGCSSLLPFPYLARTAPLCCVATRLVSSYGALGAPWSPDQDSRVWRTTFVDGDNTICNGLYCMWARHGEKSLRLFSVYFSSKLSLSPVTGPVAAL